MLRRDGQPQMLLRIQQLEHLRLEGQGQVAIAGAVAPCEIHVRQALPKVLLRPVAHLLNGSAGEGIHGKGAGHIRHARPMDQLVSCAGEGGSHEQHPVAVLQQFCNVLPRQRQTAGGKCAVLPAQGQHPKHHAGVHCFAQLRLAALHDGTERVVRRFGTAHVPQRLPLVDGVQGNAQHFVAALMMPPTASLIFRAT